MSSSQVFQNHPGIYTSESMPNLDAGQVATQWYTPTSYPFDPSYITPLPTSGRIDNQSWTHLPVTSEPKNNSMSPYIPQPHSISIPPPYQMSVKDVNRPRSSPSTFGPTPDNIAWPQSGGLGIYPAGSMGQPTPPVTSTFPPNLFHTYPTEAQYVKNEQFLKDKQQSVVASPPELQQPQPRRPYPSIAPDPAGIAAQKRKRDDDENQDINSSGKKRKRTSSVASADLSEDDRLLVSLKEHRGLPWKEIASLYSAEKGKTHNVAALQMKYKRLCEKHAVWTEHDVDALRKAHEIWEKRKWEIIREKMADFDLDGRWNPKQCAKKWQELETAAVASLAPPIGLTPTMSHFSTSQFSSPIDAPAHFPWMPLS